MASITAGAVTADKFVSPTLNSFRVAQNCGTRAFFATHQDTSTLNVFTWDEAQAPRSRNWLRSRAGSRATVIIRARRTADLAGSRRLALDGRDPSGIGSLFRLGGRRRFESSPAALRPDRQDRRRQSDAGREYQRLRLRFGDLLRRFVEQRRRRSRNILHDGRRPAISEPRGRNSDGNAKGCRRRGRRQRTAPEFQHQSRRMGRLFDGAPCVPGWQLFAATGYTMVGGQNASNVDALPRFVLFGRSRSMVAGPGGAAGAPAAATAAPSPPMPARAPRSPPEDGDPIVDVNTLRVVSAEVADKIKAAAGFGSVERAARSRGVGVRARAGRQTGLGAVAGEDGSGPRSRQGRQKRD